MDLAFFRGKQNRRPWATKLHTISPRTPARTHPTETTRFPVSSAHRLHHPRPFLLTTTSNTIWARRCLRRAATRCMHDGPAVLRIALFRKPLLTAALLSCRQHRPPLHLFLSLSMCSVHQRYHRLCPIAGIRSGLFCTLYCARIGWEGRRESLDLAAMGKV